MTTWKAAAGRWTIHSRTASPTYLYDGDCGICRSSMHWAARVGAAFTAVPYQEADLDAAELTVAECARSGHFVEPTSEGGSLVSRGADSWIRLMRTAPQPWRALAVLAAHGPVHLIARLGYLTVANSRSSRTNACTVSPSRTTE